MIITISREFGSGGRELGKRLAEALHIPQNSVSSRLRRARAMLQIDMEGGKDA